MASVVSLPSSSPHPTHPPLGATGSSHRAPPPHCLRSALHPCPVPILLLIAEQASFSSKMFPTFPAGDEGSCQRCLTDPGGNRDPLKSKKKIPSGAASQKKAFGVCFWWVIQEAPQAPFLGLNQIFWDACVNRNRNSNPPI